MTTAFPQVRSSTMMARHQISPTQSVQKLVSIVIVLLFKELGSIYLLALAPVQKCSFTYLTIKTSLFIVSNSYLQINQSPWLIKN